MMSRTSAPSFSPLAGRTFDSPVRDGQTTASSGAGLREEVIARLSSVVDQSSWIESATLTGSFLTGNGLDGIGDIDFVVVVDHLHQERFAWLQQAFRDALAPTMRAAGYRLQINPTLGPLKLNNPQTAVLHLMLYSHQAHVEHAIHSPFTCFDWQRSEVYFRRPLAAVYPVFGLQPHHFVSARRSVRDYLPDYQAGIVSYRELNCDSQGYREVRRENPMTLRCRHEFAYHILRFLMQNLLKLVRRRNETPDGAALLSDYLALFPEDGAGLAEFYAELARKKKSHDFSQPTTNLDARLEAFVASFERQFRREFCDQATRHIVFRHAPTAWNHPGKKGLTFLGRSDVPIEPLAAEQLNFLCEALHACDIRMTFVSPLARCRQSLEELSRRAALPAASADPRLLEIDYGRCEHLTAAEACDAHPELLAAWQRGEDIPFPGGESSTDVALRAVQFTQDCWQDADGGTLTCTHNVVLRTLVGQALGVPPAQWHRLRIPHLMPIHFVQTRRFGWFADLEEAVEREIFADFARPPAEEDRA